MFLIAGNRPLSEYVFIFGSHLVFVSCYQKSSTRAFLTELPDNGPDEKEKTTLKRPKYGVPLNCDPESIGSVRRSTKQIFSSSLTKSFSDLEKLKVSRVDIEWRRTEGIT